MLFRQTTKIRFYNFSILLNENKFLKCINFSLSYLLFAYVPDLLFLGLNIFLKCSYLNKGTLLLTVSEKLTSEKVALQAK